MKLHAAIAPTPKAREIALALMAGHVSVEPEEADVILVFGGDGFMLRCLHNLGYLEKPFYGVNGGTVGFLLNAFKNPQLSLENVLSSAAPTHLKPLTMEVHTGASVHKHLAINEVSLLRQTHQAIKMKLAINGKVQMEDFAGDGVIISTPAGSTAYNRSAGGPIIPLGVPLLSVMPLCPLRPRGWNGALIDDNAEIELEIIEPSNRMVSACADYVTIAHAHRVKVSLNRAQTYTLLFDKGHNLEDRIIAEQFK